MSRVLYQSTAALADPDGTLRALAGVQVYVYEQGTQVTAPIYKVRSSGPPIANPMITDATGEISFYAETGEYDIRLRDSQIPPRVADQTSTVALVDPLVETADIAAGAIELAQLSAAALQALVPAGSIWATARSTAPPGWLLCDGAAVAKASYSDLWDAIGDTYALGPGDINPDFFRLPDLRGRVPVGVDGAAGRLTANDALGQAGGAERVSLTIAEMPQHTHGYSWPQISTGAGVVQWQSGAGMRVNDQLLDTTQRGNGHSHNNMPPFQIVTWMVKT